MIGKFTSEQIVRAREGIFDTAVDIMYIFDIDDLKILDMNASGLGELGYTLQEVRQKTFYDIHAIEERARAEQVIEQYRREGGILGVRDLHLRRKNGSLLPVEKSGRITEVDGIPVAH
jgi:PAS domain S-box-containing protein